MDAFQLFDEPEVKEEFSQAFDKLDRIEAIQLLSDLKYLPLKAFEDGEVDTAEMTNAIERFRLDFIHALNQTEMSNLIEIKLASEIIDQEELFPDVLSHREIYILKEITGLDNELIINDIKDDEISLLSRVLIYRYRVYDLVSTVLPNHNLTSEVKEKLQKSAKDIGYDKDWLKFGNLLANQEELSSFCTNSPVLNNNVFGDCIFIKLTTKEGRSVIRELGRHIRKKSRFLNTMGSNSAKTIIGDLINHNNPKEVAAEVDKYITNVPNIFMRRVLQVKLWMMGLYQGRLDHYFGPKSVNALSDYLMTLIDDPDKGKEELGRILYNLKRDQCIININYLLIIHFIPVEKANLPVEQSSVSQIFDFVLEDKMSVSSMRVNRRVEIQQESNELEASLKTELRTESKEIIQQGKNQLRRQYRAKKGIMKFFSNLFKFLKNAYTKIKKLLKKLLRLIKKVSRIIYDEIREAFQNFRNGLKFLFGNRIIKPTPNITTDYDFDFDGITRIHSKPSQDDLKLHSKTIRGYSSAIYPTLDFIKNVIQWGIRFSTGPIGWVKILVGIAKLFKSMIKQRTVVELGFS